MKQKKAFCCRQSSRLRGFLQIGQPRAYEKAHEHLHSGGTAGMPVIRLGPGCLRVPCSALLVLATTGRLVRPCDVEAQPSGAPRER